MTTLETDSFADTAALTCFQLAAWLTDPVCKARENFVWLHLIDQRYPEASKVYRVAEKFFSGVRLAAWGVLSLVTSPIGIGLRYLGTKIAPHSFTHLSVKGGVAVDRPRSLFILLYNECCVDGGYSMTDGGVVPKGFRFEENTKRILAQNNDIVGSCEIFDVNTALARAERLKPFYKNVYVNIGPQTVGTSSALFFATKFDTANPSFTRFPQQMLVGRTKQAGKGVFSVEIGTKNPQFQKIATIFLTHLQHSEIPEKAKNTQPEDVARRQEEEAACRNQMNLILSLMEKVEGPALLMGDLNLDDDEYNASSWKDRFIRVLNEGHTWGGDAACAALVNKIYGTHKPDSKPLNLDYILVLKKPEDNTTIQSTEIAFETRFKGGKFTADGQPEALSDHSPLRAEITLSA